MRYLITLLILLWAMPCQAGILLLIPEVPKKPIIDLKVEDPVTHEISERPMTEKELLDVATYDARKGNFTTVEQSLKGSVTGKYKYVISHEKSPIWSKDEIKYSIVYFADMKRIKEELKPSGTVTMIDTKELGGAEWLIKNGYEAEANNELEAKVEPK